MKGDRELCTAAVAQDGKALQWASEEMKGDRELCTAAVTQNWYTFEWASEEMKGDRELCMAAVVQDASALKHVSQVLKADPSFVTAVRDEIGALRWEPSAQEWSRGRSEQEREWRPGCGYPPAAAWRERASTLG